MIMTRDEEIRNQAIKDQKSCFESMDWRAGFMSGAKWADSNPKISKEEFIEKVRSWLENHTYDDKYWTPDGDDLFRGNLISDICKYLEEEL